MKALKTTGILLLALLTAGVAAYGVPGAALEVESALNSVTTDAVRPCSYALDGDPSTEWGLAENAAYGRLEITLSTENLIYGLVLHATVTSDTRLDFEFQQDGRWVPFVAASLSEVNATGLFVDLSYDRVVSDRIALVLSGDDADLSSVQEVEVRGVAPQTIRHRIRPTGVTVSENASYFEPVQSLTDGNPRTSWSGAWNGDWPENADIAQKMLKDISKEDRRSPHHSSDADAQLELGEKYNIEEIRLYVTDMERGSITVSVRNDGSWSVLGSLRPQMPAGWYQMDAGGIEADAVEVSIPTGHSRASLGEVEIWGTGSNPGSTYEDVGYETTLLADTPVNFQFTVEEGTAGTLEVALRGEHSENLMLDLNGIEYQIQEPILAKGLSIYRLELESDSFWSGDNYLRLQPLSGDAEILTARFRHEELDGSFAVMGDELGDGFLFTAVNATERSYTFGRSLLLSALEVHGATAGTYTLKAFRNGRWEAINPSSVEQDKTVYEPGFITDRILLETRGATLGEIRVLGSPTTDQAPKVRFVQSCEETAQSGILYATDQGVIIGFVDNPDAEVRVNEVRTWRAGQYFWTTASALGFRSDEPLTLTAVATDNERRTGQATILYATGLDSLATLDQTDDTIYCLTTSCTISGTLRMQSATVKVNGTTATSTKNRFSASVTVVEGLNIVRVSVYQWRTQRLLGTLIKKVVCSTSPLRLILKEPTDGAYLTKSTVTLRGLVMGAGIESVTVGGQEATRNGVRFTSQPVTLAEGANAIAISATDRFSRTANLGVTLHLDSTAPTVTIGHPVDGGILATANVTISGTATDAGPTWVFVNGRAAEREGDGYSLQLPFTDGQRSASVYAKDAAGNKSTTLSVSFTVDTVAPQSLTVAADPSGWTNNTQPVISFSATDATSGIDHYEMSVAGGAYSVVASPHKMSHQEDGSHEVRVKAVDRAGWTTTASTTIYVDTTAPAAPSVFRAVPGNGVMILRWVKPSDDTVTYDLSRVPAWDTGTRTLSEEVYEDTAVSNGGEYSYAITATDHAANTGEAAGTEAIVGLAVSGYAASAGAVVEYEDVTLFVSPGSLPEEVEQIAVFEVQSEDLEEAAFYPIVSPIYDFCAVIDKNGTLEAADGVSFEKPFHAVLNYDVTQIPDDFPEQNLGAYYYDTMWSRWFKVPDSVVDMENHRILFSTTHFTSFSVQPTVLEDLSPQELKDVGQSPFRTDVKHGGVTVSPQGGTAMTQVTELTLPGKAGFDFVLKRTYDTATARADAVGLSLNASVGTSSIIELISGGAFDALGYLASAGWQVGAQVESAIKKVFQNSGDWSYSMGLGWRLNLPYMRSSNSTLLVRLPSGAFYSIEGMKQTEVVSEEDNRSVSFENHDGEDFILRAVQARTDVDITSLLKSGVSGSAVDSLKDILDRMTLPGWALVQAELIMKDGTRYEFDAYGHVTSITDPTGLNTMAFQYGEDTTGFLLLNSIVDSMGRKILFTYNTEFLLPQVKTISVENDPTGRYIEYTAGSALSETTHWVLPLLQKARDIGGREWEYSYDTKFLFGGNIGFSVNFVTLVGDIIAAAVSGGSGFGAVSSIVGKDSISVNGAVQAQFVFPLNLVHGPGTGSVSIVNSVKDLSYADSEWTDYIWLPFVGWVPTGFSASMNLTNRILTSSVTQTDYMSYSTPLTTNYTYDFAYYGYDQFYNKVTTVSDGRTSTSIDYAVAEKTVLRWIEESDAASEGYIFVANPYTTQVIPYETRQVKTDSNTGSVLETTETEWDTATMRITGKKVSRSATNYERTDYAYDDWGNVIHQTNYRTTTDDDSVKAESKQETWAYYNCTETNPWPGWDVPDGYAASSFTRTMKDRVLAQKTEASVPNLDGMDTNTTRMYRYEYNPLGQKTGEYRKDGGSWAKTSHVYDGTTGEIIKTTDPVGHVRSINYDYGQSGQYVIKVAEEGVKDADGGFKDLVHSTGYQTATGFKIWEKNARGFVTAFSYDSLGRTVLTVKSDEDDDAAWQPGADCAGVRPVNPCIRVEYDDSALTATVTGARGQMEAYGYDSLGHMVRMEKTSRSYGGDGTPADGGSAVLVKTTVTYDPWGQIVSIVNPRGYATVYQYDAMGRTSRITYPSDDEPAAFKAFSFDYSTNTQVVTDENGNTAEESYDLADKLLRRIQVAGSATIVTQWWYDGYGNLVAERDGEGRTTLHGYNELGLETKKTLPQETFYEGREAVYSPKLTTTYDRAGHKTGELLSLSSGDQTVSYVVDGMGRTIRTERAYTDYSGQTAIASTAVELAFYDENGNKTEIIDANNSGLAKADRKSKAYAYSSRDKMMKETDESGNVKRYEYDLDDHQAAVTDPRGNVTAYSGDFTMKQYYDDLGRLYLAELPKDSGQTEKPRVSLSYDLRGNLVSRTEADGGITTYQYSARDKAINEERKGTTSTGSTVTMTTQRTYDKVGNETSITDSRNQTTQEAYDALNRLIQVTYPEGNTEEYGYDNVGNRTRETNGNGHSIVRSFDSRGKEVSSRDASGYTTRTLYNGRGDRTYHRDANGNVTIWTYDERGLPVKETDATGAERRYSYDAAERLTDSTDPRGTSTSIAYTATNLPETFTRVNGSLSEATTNRYDEAGQLYSTSRGGVTLSYNMPGSTYTPNAYGNVHDLGRTVSGETYTVHYDYDQMNRVTAITSPDGTTVPYLYDTLGRLERVSGYIDGQIRYDANGRLDGYRAVNGMSVNAAHDANGRLTALNYTGTTEALQSFSLGYDGASNVTSKNGSSYAYDELERLISARQEGRFAVDPARVQPDIGMKAEDYGEGGVLDFEAEELTLRLDYAAMSIGADLGGSYELTKLVIRPEATGHRISVDNISVSTADYNWEGSYEKQTDWSFQEGEEGEMQILFRQPVTTRYVKLHCFYDDRGADNEAVDKATVRNDRAKLLVVYYNATIRTETYTYDAKGNRTTMGLQVGSTILNLTYGYYTNTDRLKADGEWGYVYDGNGNLTGKGNVYVDNGSTITLSTTEGESWGYEYDLENRLTSVRHGTAGTDSLALVTSYLYDPLGMKVKASSVKRGESVTIHGTDGTLVYEKTTGGDRSYVYALGRHIAKVETVSSTSTTTYYVTDHLGSTVMETDATGRVVWSTDYSAFGETAHEAGLEEEGGKYTGKEKDPETHLYYFNARWYCAETGRFISEDPARDGSNWFVYCGNNPLSFFDPMGLETKPLLGNHWVSGAFGSSPGNIAGTSANDTHAGVDLTSSTRQVVAAKAGAVEFAGVHPDGQASSTGCLIIVKYGEGNYGLFGHMDPNGLSVAVGATVTEGQPLGTYYNGSIGTSNGPHLHYEEYSGVTAPADRNDLARFFNWTGYFYDQSSVPEDKKTINSSGTEVTVVKPIWQEYVVE